MSGEFLADVVGESAPFEIADLAWSRKHTHRSNAMIAARRDSKAALLYGCQRRHSPREQQRVVAVLWYMRVFHAYP